jgi:catechol 2,3-dioxygenase-like lactoylglutathione lyase family enzyme
MPVTVLQHVNIRCADVERSRAFYRLLGLIDGDRPPFASMGYWMYAGAEPVVHLVQKKPGEATQGPGTGELDHIALGAAGLTAMREDLKNHGIAFREAIVPRDGSVQLFVPDPDGVTLELNFSGPDG